MHTSETKTNNDCRPHSNLDPCLIVIFGASGDLTSRKLIPALFQMYVKKSMPERFAIVGAARSDFSSDQFHEKLKKFCVINNEHVTKWEEFIALLHYQQVIYNEPDTYIQLREFLQELDAKEKTQGNVIFDLAVPPNLYPVITKMLGEAGLSRQYENSSGWSRIIIEKPFGRDIQSARDLQKVLESNFEEEQIFRIDHYLAKETVQNILTFRFANAIFEPLWNNNYIDYIGIVATEELGVESRAGYYEQSGVIRDMFQNHMLQLMALSSMEPPSHFEANCVRDEKTKVFKSVRSFSDRPQDDLVLGQYGPGRVRNQDVSGYLQEPGVSIGSLTPTYAMMRLHVDNWRWKGVPFYLVSGKRLASKETKLVVQFKKVPFSMFENVLSEKISANRLTLGIYPEEEIKLNFQVKNPGPRICMNPMTMDFKYQDNFNGQGLEAYEKVLLDCILGDQMLFWRRDGVEAAWSLITPILNDCENCIGREQKLHKYPAGSWGPKAAMDWWSRLS